MPRYEVAASSAPHRRPRHCHRNAIFGMGSDEAVFAKLGLDFELLDAGCCGIAGAFGFVKKHYNVSIDCDERVLLPTVRAAGEPTVDRD